MKKLTKALLLMSLILIMTDCREPFMPDFETGINDYLVVEGFIHVGQKVVTTITLSRVAPLQSASQVFEKSASLHIENENGIQYPLNEVEDGIYRSDSLDLDPTLEYRLLITTQTGNQSISDFTKPRTAPVIDSIYWQWEDDGIRIYVDTHDSENNTLYYKWEYKEVWEIHSDYRSRYSYSNGVFTGRTVPEINSLYKCWQYDSSKNLHFASSSQFEEDRIRYPLLSFAHQSNRTSVLYSIFVEQRALTKEEFDFLQLIQKNSTVTGSLFDPMPGELSGNIRSLNTAAEDVIGYIGASTTQTKRIFISAFEFGAPPFDKCELIEAYNDQWDFYFADELYIPVDGHIPIDNPDSAKYSGALKNCMDCRLYGNPIKPDFWP